MAVFLFFLDAPLTSGVVRVAAVGRGIESAAIHPRGTVLGDQIGAFVLVVLTAS
jgi:hypothetical protein